MEKEKEIKISAFLHLADLTVDEVKRQMYIAEVEKLLDYNRTSLEEVVRREIDLYCGSYCGIWQIASGNLYKREALSISKKYNVDFPEVLNLFHKVFIDLGIWDKDKNLNPEYCPEYVADNMVFKDERGGHNAI